MVLGVGTQGPVTWGKMAEKLPQFWRHS